MLLFDPVYHDQRAVRVEIILDKMAAKNEWNSTTGIAHVATFWKQRNNN